MLTADFFRVKFDRGLAYAAYLETAKPHERENWHSFHARAGLTGPQQQLIASFTRKIKALCISGAWCGDCVQQCPFFDHIARANAACIDLRFVDRDEHKDLSDQLKICGGNRVPVLLLLNEDCEFVALAGDRTLTRYRAIAARQLGPSCPLPGAPVPDDEITATRQDWVDEFERAHLLVRLSPRLRQRHGD
jgi:hypothetical protein